ncbi:phosphotransferase enzyme family protein [Roseiarcus fermentans]|nr:phosphotransferase [Roseiarcus fermentans]
MDFEPVYSTPRAEAVARFLAERYAVATPLDCRMLNRGFNDVYLVVTASGDRYVFRISHLRARGAADVAAETAFLAHLDRMGVPVAAPIATREGALFVRGLSPEGLREGVLFRALDGRAPDPGCADARANGVTLAMVHDAASSFSPPSSRYTLDLDHLLRRPLARLEKSGLIESAATSAEFEGVASRTAQAIESLDLTWTYCHGDCHGFNARMTDAGAAAFFDFDDGGPGYLAYDLAVFLWAKVSFGRKQHASWRAFLEGYQSVRTIAPNDLEAAHAFVIVRHIWLIGEYSSRTEEWGREPARWVGREIEFLKAWQAETMTGRLF